MSIVRTFVAALLAALSLVVVTAAPSFACSCAAGSVEEYVGSADVVVAGTVSDRAEPPLRPVMSSGDPVTYTVEVESVFKGSVPPTAYVLSAVSGASCGLEGVEEGDRYVFFADEVDRSLSANLCGGSGPASPRLLAQIEQVTGPPDAADPAAEPTVRPAVGAGLALPMAVGTGLALALLAGTLWLRLARRG